ncbi:MAG: DUF1173 domain-containing protein [Hydrogenophaga sp.]|nr:DUF1173 domain-containing protein [Hydrogenophaga sp.]
MHTPGFAHAIAEAYANHQRPRCLCRPDGDGIEMYVARLMNGYIVKRMPNTGSQHATACPSYELPSDLSGLGQLVGTAIVENPSTGETALKLDFPLSKLPGRSSQPPAASASPNIASQGQKLSLRALLHYLWDQAELTHWHPGFAGKRNWAIVRRHLLSAAAHKFTHGSELQSRLYVPEVFSVEHRAPINARRLAEWTSALAHPGKPSQLMLLIGEVKEIVPSRYGFRAVIKHIPDQAFAIDERLFRQLERRFAGELALWGAFDSIHLVMVGTFCVSYSGLPTIDSLSLVTFTPEWIPVDSPQEAHLVRSLVSCRRSFVKTLRYNLCAGTDMASAVLTDLGEPVELYIATESDSGEENPGLPSQDRDLPVQRWEWHPSRQTLPPFPTVKREALA